MKNFSVTLRVLVAILVIVSALSIVIAQEIAPIEPLAMSTEPVVVDFSVGAAGPPTIEPLTDGRITFRIPAAGEVSGALAGSITASISEVTAMPSPPLHPVTVMFTIETEQGTIQGFYAGGLHLPEGEDSASIHASGLILSVSGAYADLYLADVYVSSSVQFVDGRSTGESGTMTLIAR